MAAIIPGLFLGGSSAMAQTNSWSKPTSGYWEEPFWSLGILPGPDQTVMFTNAGWKALAIGAQTAQNFPESLTVRELFVATPSNSLNTLLLNFAGLERPLRAGAFTLGSGSGLVILSSALEAGMSGYNSSIEGNVNHGDFSRVVFEGPLFLRGNYNLTNGTLTTGYEYMGGAGRFNQYGGDHTIGLILQMDATAAYYLYDGTITGSIGIGSAQLNQSEGQVNGNLFVGQLGTGTYRLSGGVHEGGMLVPQDDHGNGGVVQTGGSNIVQSVLGLEIGKGSRFGGQGSYVLSNGVLLTTATSVRTLGAFSQYGGSHVVDNGLLLRGSDLGSLGGLSYSTYTLAGGSLSAQSLAVSMGIFAQSGGTNQMAGDVNISSGFFGSTYNLSGGLFQNSNVTVVASSNGGFSQSGGRQEISSRLSVSGTTNGFIGFSLSAGELSVKDIVVTNGAVFHHSGGTLAHSGMLTLANGGWETKPGFQPLGPLQLSTGLNSSSTLSMPAAAATARFAVSSGLAWSPQAILTIQNWAGSLTGSGQHQVIFGTSSAGLSAQQVGQIRFLNPAGRTGLYPARILATGEVVPGDVSDTGLTFTRSGNFLILTWGSGWTLQSATSVTGAFIDVNGATSPYVAPLTEPQRFFRLRR